MSARAALSMLRRVRLVREFRASDDPTRGRVVLAVTFLPDPACPACSGRGEVERWSNDPPDLWADRCGCTAPRRPLGLPLRTVTLDLTPPF